MIHEMIFVAFVGQLISTAFATDTNSHTSNWRYDNSEIGPDSWVTYHPLCNGTKQSPINIIENEVIYNSSLTPLVLLNYSNVFDNGSYYLLNNGHTVTLEIELNGTVPIGLIWKGKQYNYYALHFHWGNNDGVGSEHLFNNQSNPLEIHIVHYLNDYGNFNNALSYSDGLLVWSNIFKIDEMNNTSLNDVFSHVKDVVSADNKTYISPLALSSFVAENSTSSYYHYEGSLTTPECTESVMWIVNQKFMKVSSVQLNAFRQLRGHSHNISNLGEQVENLTLNFRPTQPLNGRNVYTSVKPIEVGTTNSTIPTNSTTSTIFTLSSNDTNPTNSTSSINSTTTTSSTIPTRISTLSSNDTNPTNSTSSINSTTTTSSTIPIRISTLSSNDTNPTNSTSSINSTITTSSTIPTNSRISTLSSNDTNPTNSTSSINSTITTSSTIPTNSIISTLSSNDTNPTNSTIPSNSTISTNFPTTVAATTISNTAPYTLAVSKALLVSSAIASFVIYVHF